jgi:hypothetical protein
MNFRTLALIGTAIAKSDAFALSPRSTTIAFSASSSRHHRHLGAASTVSSLNNSRGEESVFPSALKHDGSVFII